MGSNAMVVELPREDNYANWRACMVNYLFANDLLELVEKAAKHPDDLNWKKKNAAVLHAIQISCSPNILSYIRDELWAKDAWDKLAETCHPVKATVTSNQLGTGSKDRNLYNAFLEAAECGDWDKARRFLDKPPEAWRDLNINNIKSIALRQAIVAGHVHFVEELVKKMPDSLLEMQNNVGVTALHTAAMTGITPLAKCIVKKNERLLHFEADNGMIPVTLASCVCHTDMTRYLYTVTSLGDLNAKAGIHGATLLSHCISAKIFDVALDLLQKSPDLAFCRDKDGITPIYALAQVPSLFRSGSELSRTRQWIYDCIRTQPLQLSSAGVHINIQDDDYKDQNTSRNPGLWHRMVSKLLDISGVKELYKMKSTHNQATQLLDFMCKDIEKFGSVPAIDEALTQAVSYGITEFFNSIIKVNPDVLWIQDKNKRNLFMLAIQHRQEKIFRLIYGFEREKNALASYTDSFGNNMLHFAGCLAPSARLQRIPGAALQMQRELQWFKEVEKIVHPKCKEARNVEGFTPRELFSETHKSLKKDGEEWMKETARSSSVVGALIMTITFAAIFTVPGGNDQTKGYPIFLHHKLFMVFIIFDALSLVSSSASVFMFLGILTSRYSEDDFLKSLPDKMIIGLSTLFFSILAMMVAFCAALDIMKDGKLWVVVATSLLACVPVFTFNFTQFGLIVDMLIYRHIGHL